MTIANHTKQKQHNEPMRMRRKTRDRRQARENARGQGVIGSWFSIWLVEYYGGASFKRITERTNAKLVKAATLNWKLCELSKKSS